MVEWKDRVFEQYKDAFYSCGDLCEYYGFDATADRLMNFDKDPNDKDLDIFQALQYQYYIETNELFQVKHIGLTMEQIKEFNLPENPTKMTDSRADGYVEKFGRHCWEVDAIDLVELRRIVTNEIENTIDMKVFKRIRDRERHEISELEDIINNLKK